MADKVCLIAGVGPGTGSAMARRFATDYRVALLARKEERLRELERDLPNAKAYPCDVTDVAQVAAVLDSVRKDLGDPEVFIHNAVGGGFGDFLEIDPEMMERNFQVNTMALLRLGKALAPAMIEAGRGAIVCTANTSAYRGKANFAGFAPTKAAQRILAESMARSLGPKGVHVAFLAIDAVIDLHWTRKAFPDRPDDFFIQPRDIAEEAWHLAHQPPTAWSFDVLIRPPGEVW